MYGVMFLFADHMTIVFHHKNFNILNEMIDKDMKSIFDWLSQNRLIINKSQSRLMIIGTNNKHLTNSYGTIEKVQ